ncbi:hypothetical protein [Streptomyces sp. NPDC091268]|uniref:hypothetical protein n=1 Tax=Streptomyces sp. NPDC091268 TaxID=3365979 RepID=UPI00382A86AD
MTHDDASQEEPAEHLRFWAYLSALEQVTDADEADLIREILADPDRAMAQSAVLQHLDRRAPDLLPGPAYAPWAASMARLAVHHALLNRRLQDWSFFRAIALKHPWEPEALLRSSDWLQSMAAAVPHTEAAEILAQHGRTKRIRNIAKANIKQHGSR